MQWDLANEYFLWEAFNKKVLRGGGGVGRNNLVTGNAILR